MQIFNPQNEIDNHLGLLLLTCSTRCTAYRVRKNGIDIWDLMGFIYVGFNGI